MWDVKSNSNIDFPPKYLILINPSSPDPGQREKNDLNFYFRTSLWCFKNFEASHRSVKIKIRVNFYFNATFWNARGGKD